MLDKPDQFIALASGDAFGFRLHQRHGIRVGGQPFRYAPSDGWAAVLREKAGFKSVTLVHGSSLEPFALKGNRLANPAADGAINASHRQVAGTAKSGFESLCWNSVIFAMKALVQRMTICYMQRAGQVSALPRAVVAELVDAQR